jgi:hypothetical protein
MMQPRDASGLLERLNAYMPDVGSQGLLGMMARGYYLNTPMRKVAAESGANPNLTPAHLKTPGNPTPQPVPDPVWMQQGAGTGQTPVVTDNTQTPAPTTPTTPPAGQVQLRAGPFDAQFRENPGFLDPNNPFTKDYQARQREAMDALLAGKTISWGEAPADFQSYFTENKLHTL